MLPAPTGRVIGKRSDQQTQCADVSFSTEGASSSSSSSFYALHIKGCGATQPAGEKGVRTISRFYRRTTSVQQSGDLGFSVVWQSVVPGGRLLILPSGPSRAPITCSFRPMRWIGHQPGYAGAIAQVTGITTRRRLPHRNRHTVRRRHHRLQLANPPATDAAVAPVSLAHPNWRGMTVCREARPRD